MILPSFVLNSKIKKQFNTANRLDLREYSHNPTYYDQYPWPVTATYVAEKIDQLIGSDRAIFRTL